MKALRLVVCSVVILSGLVATAPAAAAACETVWVRSYTVQADADRSFYRMGDTVEVEVLVTRAETGEPVPYANVLSIVHSGGKWALGYVRSDAAGRAVVEIKLTRKSAAPDPSARLHTIAAKEVANTPCAQVWEYGDVNEPDAFRINP
ncbi:MAG: hypothetical protein M3273_00445 [Actinomycetota bacterium]|nr:hypothetical protein [Actinomycetota bacterium]